MIPKEHPLIQFLDVFQKEADMAGERSIAPISNNTSPQTSKAAARDRAADKPGGIGAAASFSQTLWNDGRPLPEGLRSAMQSRFSYDFSDVRIHADDRAGTLADSIGANAFTVENHIVFGTSKFSPHDGKGRRLIAHELAHVVQQQPLPRDVAVVPRLGGLTPSRRGDAAEREAEAVALRADRGETVAVRESVHEVLQADWGIGALLGGIAGGVAGALIGGPIGALIGAGIGLVGGAIIGGLAAGNSIFPSYSDIVGDADAVGVLGDGRRQAEPLRPAEPVGGELLVPVALEATVSALESHDLLVVEHRSRRDSDNASRGGVLDSPQQEDEEVRVRRKNSGPLGRTNDRRIGNSR